MRRGLGTGLLGVALFVAAVVGGCARRDTPPRRRPAAPPPVPPAMPSLRLPSTPGDLAPAFTQAGDGVDGRALTATVDTCETCHAEIAAQWRASAHAATSFDNPIYRYSVERFRKGTSPEQSRFCAGCHDLALLVDGAMDGPVDPNDVRARAGVTCGVCHNATSATVDGNGSLVLDAQEAVLPTDGDAASIEAHRRRYRPTPKHDDNALCAACHRSFVSPSVRPGHHLAGIDDVGAWQRSPFGGGELSRIEVEPLERQGCRDCHMAPEKADDPAADHQGEVRSHRFAGGHTWLAAMNGDPAQRAATEAMLRKAMRIDVAAVRYLDGSLHLPAESAPLRAGETLDFEVVLENLGAGHRFPGGTRDAHATWVEVVVEDGEGEPLASSGSNGPDGEAHRLVAAVLDPDGHPVGNRDVHRFAAPGYDTTVPPRDARLVRYRWTVPEEVPASVKVSVKLWHRSRRTEVARLACAERRPSERDTCKPPPTTLVAEASARLGSAVPEAGIEQAVHRLALARAWNHALVEDLDAARPVLDLAAQAAAGGTPRLRAAIALERARLAGRQGRMRELEQWLAEVDGQLPGHPAAAWVRARALMRVFRHAEAATWLRVAAASSSDPRVDEALAVALGSAGKPRAALGAAARGLLLDPRQPDLLRVQWLSWSKIHPGAGEVSPHQKPSAVPHPGDAGERAREAFLSHRRVDIAPQLRSRCSDEVPGCARERTPAHVHLLTSAD